MASFKTINVISKKDEELLRLNQRVIEELPDLIAVVGTDYLYYYVNPAYISVHGLSTGDFLGRHIKDFLGEDVFNNIVKPNLERCIKGEDVRYEEWFDFPKAGVLYMDVRYLPLRNDQENIDRIVVILRDISYLKKAEEAKINHEKLQTTVELAGTYNHEINNPLCSLSGYLQLLKQIETDPKKISYIEKALNDTVRINKVTKKLAKATSVKTVDYPGGGKILEVSSTKRS